MSHIRDGTSTTNNNINKILNCFINIIYKKNKVVPDQIKHETLRCKIQYYYKNIKIDIKINKRNGYLELIIIKKNIIIPLLEDNTITEIKRNIDKKLKISQKNVSECIICFNPIMHIEHNIICLKCTAIWCLDCYIKSLRFSGGLINCPYCRYDYGLIKKKLNSRRNTQFDLLDIKQNNSNIFSILYY